MKTPEIVCKDIEFQTTYGLKKIVAIKKGRGLLYVRDILNLI